MTRSRRISGLAAVLVAVLLFVTLASSVESTQAEFKNASWQLIDSDSTPGSILIGKNTDTQNPAGPLPNVGSRWSSRFMDSDRNDTRWLDIDWNGSQPAGTDVRARVLTADGFVDWGPFNSVSNTQLTSWKRTFTRSYDYADFRTNYLGFTNVSFRGLGHNASSQDPSVWYTFEGITSSVKDFTGNGNTASLDSADRQDGYTGKAAYFDGSSSFSASSTGTSLTSPSGSIWMEMWVNPTNLGSSRQTLIDKQEEFRLNLENNGEVWFRTYGNTSRESGTLPQNQWSHVAVHWDAGNSVTVYVNGTETTNRQISDTSPNTGNTVYFGQTYQGDQSFTGYIDEFRAFRNKSNVDLMTDVTDFSSPVQEAGETTSNIDRQYVQAMIRPESTDSYTVDNIRVGSNTSYSSWSDSGELLDAPQRRYGLIQLNLSGTDTESPRVDEVRLDASIPDNNTAPEQPEDATPGGEVDVLWDQPLAIEIGINDSNISTTNNIEVDYRMTNLNLFCSFNSNTGLCERVTQNKVTTNGNRLLTNNYPIYTNLNRELDGGESKTGSFQFTVPPSDFRDWTLQVNQKYNFRGEHGEAVSNTIVDYTGPSRAGQGDSCTYPTDCQKGLYCGDTNGDSTPDTCIEQDNTYTGNICAKIGSGYKERIIKGGSCELSNPGSENSNNPAGVQCSTSSDCTTNYCYDSNSDGTKTCQTSPTSGTSSGTPSGVNATQPASCYFAGQTYSEGTSIDIFSDGVTNTCSNGKWEHDVKAVMDYSDVTENNTIQIDYNVYNFKDGFDYSGGFIQRNTGNQIDLGEIRLDVSGETFSRSISGTVDGGRNLSGTVTVDVPELNHSDALTTRTLLDYDYGGTHQTVVGTPLKGELDSEDYTSGECRRGYQVSDTQYCVYSSQESPSSGQTVSSSSNAGNLCEVRVSSNAERRVTNSGTCKVASYGAENNNLPENYQCSTKEDCTTNYCYDDGTGYKTCETQPSTGTSAGVTSSPQSCSDNTCFYGGNCYQEGTQVEGFQVSGATSANQSMTCQSGKWNYEGELPISIEVPTDNLEQGTTGINLVTHNPYEYCSYSRGECNEITENFIELKNVAFSISDHPPQTVTLSSTLKGEDDYNNTIDVNVPDLSHTSSTRVRAVLIYEYQGELRQVSTNNVFRGQKWRNRTSGACDNGFSTAAGYFCEFDGVNQTVSGTGTITSSSSDAGGLCKSQGAGTLERVSTSGACKLASPGADNNNLPAGHQCREQSDCVTNYCYDGDQDGMKTCQPDISTGADGGLEISDETDCGENACAVVGQCYANGTTFDYYDQTLTCDEGELQANSSASPLLDLDSLASFETLKQQVAYTISPNSTVFDENAAIKFSFQVWNQRPYCDEDQTTGLCTRIDSNLVQTDLIRSWFDLQISRFDKNINLYGGEKKQGSFVAKVPDNQEHHDFRTELQFNIPSTGETRYSSATPVFEPLFDRGSAGFTCRYSTDCEDGLYCGDTDGDAVPDTCMATSEDTGNVCAQEGSMSERIDPGGSCDLAEPGFENKNLKEGMSCRTAEDCVTDYCYDSNGDSTLTCQTDRTNGSQTGVKATADSTGLNSCFFAGRVYSEGSSVDINADSDTETCENGLWQEEIKVDTSLSYGFSDSGQVELDYNVHNPRRACDRSSGFCSFQGQRSVDIDKIVVNVAGQQIEKTIGETVLPERNVSGTLQLSLPEIYHTQIYNTRVFAHIDDGGTQDIIATTPAVRGDTLDNRTSGGCMSGYQVMPGYFCEFGSEENPSQAGEIVQDGSGSNSGNLCAISEATAVEHRVTTSGMCQPAESGMENRNLPQGYQCTTEQDCITDYCYDRGTGDMRCQTEPQNGSNAGVLSARQSGYATTCHFGGDVYSNGTTIDVFGQSATCNQSQWDYDSEVGFKAEIPDTVTPGENLEINYSAANALRYCTFENTIDNCTVIDDNKITLQDMKIEFRTNETTVSLDNTLAGGQRHDDSVTFQVPNFDYTQNIPITVRLNAQRTLENGTTYNFYEKTTDVVRGSDWRRKTSGSCRNGYSTESGYYCSFNNETTVEYGSGNVRVSSNGAGELCETPQATTTTERISTDGTCKIAQAGARNQNQPDGNACQNQADCVSSYCYDENQDSQKTCQPTVSEGSESGLKISDETDCPAAACDIRGYCYANGASLEYNGQTQYCDNGEIRNEPPGAIPETPGQLAEDVITEYRRFTFEVFDTVVNSGTLDVGFRFTNLENFAVELHQNYITSGIGVENQSDLSITVPAGESEEFYLNSSQRPIDGVKLFYSEVRVTNSSGEINQWVTSDQTCYIGGLNAFESNCIRDDPEIREVEFNDYPNSHKFNLTARGFDPNGSTDVQTCTFRAEHENGGVREFTGNIDYSYGEDSEFLCGYDSINSSINGYEPTDHLRFVTEVEDSTGKTGTEIEGHQIPNRPPVQDEPVLNPEPALSADDLTGYTNNLVDPEGDQISLEYNWTVNNVPTGSYKQTLTSGNYSTFDWVTLYITPSDPYEEGETVSKEMQIREAIVDIQEINFENYSESHKFNTSAIVNATDPTGIETCQITASQNSNSHIFEGTINSSFGAADQISCNYSSIDSSYEGLEPMGETSVEFFIEDENNANDTASEVNPIPNTPPSVTAPTFEPDPARTSEDLTGINGTPSDPEGDEVTYVNRWYVNDVDIGFTGTTLPRDEFETGDTVRFETTPYDGYEYGETNSSSIEITDVSFSVSNLTFTDYSESHRFNVSADIFAENISEVNQCQVIADDLDGNSYSYTGTLDTNYGSDKEALCSYSSISDSESGFNATELIDVTVEASTDSATETAFGQHRIPNTPPETSEPFISPQPASENDDLTGSLGSTTDVEGDNIEVDYEWYVNGNNVSEGNMSVSEEVTLQSGNFSGRDNVSFNVTPSDPYESGGMNGTQIQISDAGLRITELRFNDSNISHSFDTEVELQSDQISQLNTCSMEFADGDGNSFSASGSIDTTYGDSNQALCTYSETGISTNGFEVNEEIEVNATVSDDTTEVYEVGFNRIPNNAIEFEQVLTDPLVPVNENSVTLNATIADPEDDPIQWANFTVTHENGTELVSKQNGSIVEGEWISPDFSVEENVNYSWTIEAYDSYDEFNETGWFTTTNDPPEITSVDSQDVVGDHAFSVEFAVKDPDGGLDVNSCSIQASDQDGNSVSVTADIDPDYGNSKQALCIYSSISDSTTGFEVEETIDFDVTATDSVGQTDTNQSQHVIPNRAPEISLDSPNEGQVTTSPVDLEWTSTDEDGDSLSFDLTVASDSSFSNVVYQETTSTASANVDGLAEGEYYWQVQANDGYTLIDSSTRSFTVTDEIENVSITLEGNFDQVEADGQQVSTGTYTDLSYPYLAATDSSGIRGLVSYGGFIEAEYRNEGGRDVIEMKQDFTGERMLLVANNGTTRDIQNLEQEITSRELLELPMASFTGRIPDQSLVSAILSYTDIDILGDETISANGNTEVLIRNEGTENGKVQVTIAER